MSSVRSVSGAPTRARRMVLGFLVVLAFLSYLDRACMAHIKPFVMADLHLTMMQMSAIFSAFALAYALFEIPTGMWSDRTGTRRVLTRIVAWWSCFTVFSGLAFNYVSMLTVRFLFGMGEAGAFPSAALTISRWIPVSEQGMAQGSFFAMAHLGGAVTPFIVGWLLYLMNWRVILVVFGTLGFIWVYAWQRWYRDDPAGHPSVNAAELELITAGTPAHADQHQVGALCQTMWHTRPLLLLCLVYAANGYGYYFLITWLPDYLRSFHTFSTFEVQLYSGLPLLLSVPADLTGGYLNDWLGVRIGIHRARILVGSVGYLCAGLAVIVSTWCTDPAIAAVLFSVGAACSMFTLGATWSACTAIGGRNTGTIGAVMNSASQIGSFCSPLVLSSLVEHYANWKLPIYVIGSFYGVAAVAWLFIDARRSVTAPRVE